MNFVNSAARALVPVALIAMVSAAAPAATSGDLKAVEISLGATQSMTANFLQTDGKGRQMAGTLSLKRPGKIRFAYGGGVNALLVADGKNVWFLDKDLEQVTVKPADAALSSTPAMLLSGVANLRDSFTLTQAGSREGLDWVLVEPRKPEADFRRALFGFSKGDLRKMIIDDRLGQTATIELASVERNAKVDPQEVSFTPPKDADVIGTPAK